MLGYQPQRLSTQFGVDPLSQPTQPLCGPLTASSAETRQAWRVLIAAAQWCRAQGSRPVGLAAAGEDPVRQLAEGNREALCRFAPGHGWSTGPAASARQSVMFDLYLPLCAAHDRAPLTVAHLGQSIDGSIATASGDSYYVTGAENIRHLHRMRALCDAVLVGAATVQHDNPELTTRGVEGDHALRIVLDPKRRLADSYRVFQDNPAPTLLICDERYVDAGASHGRAEVVGIPAENGQLRLDLLLARLHARDIRALFVEGGGATVSGFLQAGLLDRLQIAVAPLIVGSGRPGIRLPETQVLMDGLRPARRVFRMGQDLLFDFDLRAAPPDVAQADDDSLSRIL